MKRKYELLAFVILASMVREAVADEVSRNPKILMIVTKDRDGVKAKYQYCYSKFTIDENGNWTAWTKFSNGKNIDGDHFQAILIVKDKSGRNCLALNQVAGLRAATFCKGSCEREVTHSGTSSVTSYDLTDSYTYQCTGYDEKDDLLAATGATVAIACAAAGLGSSCASGLSAAAIETGQTGKKSEIGCSEVAGR